MFMKNPSSGVTGELCSDMSNVASSPLSGDNSLSRSYSELSTMNYELKFGALVGGLMAVAQNRIVDYWFDERLWRIIIYGRP